MNAEDLPELLRMPPRRRVAANIVRRVERSSFVVEELHIDLGGARPVRGFLTRPPMASERLPGVLYCHAHGAEYGIGAAELTDGRASLINPYGPVLAQRGFVTLSIDMPTFGDRQVPGESALSKALLWQGKTLMGEMIGDLLAAFEYLATRDDVDPRRIAALGLSMGATHAFFLGALEPRFNRIAHLCCYADWAVLVETGAHDRHGHYMTVPGLLAKTSIGEIAGMIAPRPQLICVGEADPLTPPEAVMRAYDETLSAYSKEGAEGALRMLVAPDSGHVETPGMRQAVLTFLDEM
jgi:cephalosporin-C deacetylase-like acetyl esterase